MEAPKSEVIKALGRPFAIGYLYDIRRDIVINRSPWKNSELKEPHIAVEPQNFTDFKVTKVCFECKGCSKGLIHAW